MKKISRRTFIKQGVALSTAAMWSGPVLSSIGGVASGAAQASKAMDMSIVTGNNFFNNTIKAVDMLGGIKNFVPRNSRVCLLINSPFANPGSHAHPDVALAVVKMCFEAGAGKVVSLKKESAEYWSRSLHAREHEELIKQLTSPGKYVAKSISRGKALKKIEIFEDVFACDVFINVSIAKQHKGTNFSCLLKNMMGALPHSTCMFFHKGTGGKGWYDDLDHLNQCIADLNLIRKPDLVIADATEFITTNGPYGPGKMAKPLQVVAGTDRVLVDSYCCTLLGLRAEEVQTIRRAAEHNLGQTDLKKATIQKAEG